MNSDQTTIGYLRGALILLALAVVIGAGAAVWCWFTLQRAEAQNKAAIAKRAEIQGKLARASLEEQELRTKIARFRTLDAKGYFGAERRLDWIEAMAQIRSQRRLPDLRYELSPVHPVDKALLPSGPKAADRSFASSTMTLTANLLHEGDLLGVLADIRERVPAYPVLRKCVMRRAVKPDSIGGAALETVCEMDWITVQENS